MKPLKAKVSITLDTDVIDQLKQMAEEDRNAARGGISWI